MERDKEAAADPVVDIPQTRDYVGNARREEGPAKAQRAFDARYGSGRRTTGGEDHYASSREAPVVELVKIQSPGVTRRGIGSKEKPRPRRGIGAGGGMASEVHHLAAANTLQERCFCGPA